MKKIFRIALWTAAIFAVLVLGMLVYLRNADLSVYKDYVEAFLSRKIGHELRIDGAFELHFGSHTSLTAERISLSNPEWPSAAEIASAEHVSATVDLWSLLSGPVIVDALEVRGVRIHLERSADARANWTTGKETEEAGESGGFDPTGIAFRHVGVANVDFRFDDALREAPLHVKLERLTIEPDQDNVLDLDLDAVVNDIPVWADGKLGPWDHLIDGSSITADLDLTLGRTRLGFNGTVDDLKALEGVELDLNLEGPTIERVIRTFGLPPFAAGRFHLAGRVNREGSGSRFRLEGNLGDIQLVANGITSSLIHFEDASLDFNFTGPDAQHVAEVFGIQGVNNRPFRLSGDLNVAGKRLEFSGAKLAIGDNSLGLDGWVDTSSAIPDGDVTVAAAGPDFSNIGLLAGLQGVPKAEFDIHGRVRKTGGIWQVDDVNARIGHNRFKAGGEIDAISSSDREIRFRLSGDDLSILQAMTGIEGLPPKPFDVAARVRRDPLGVRLVGAEGSVGDNRLAVDGVIATGEDFVGTDIDVHASGPDLGGLPVLGDVEYLPVGPFSAGGRLRVTRQGLRLDDLSARAGGLEASVTGTVTLGKGAGMELDLSLSGKDVAKAADLDMLQRLAGEPFLVGGHLSGRRGEFVLKDIGASLGNVKLQVDGRFGGDGQAAHFTVRANAPDTLILRRLTALKGLGKGAFSAKAAVDLTGEDIRLDDASVHIGKYSMTADGTLSLAPMENRSDLRFSASGPDLRRLFLAPDPAAPPGRPFSIAGAVNGTPSGFAVEDFVATLGDNRIDSHFDVDLHAKPRIHGRVSSRFVDLTRLMAGTDEGATRSEKKRRGYMFPDTPLPVNLLKAADLDLTLRTDRLITPEADMLDLDVDLKLENGDLQIGPVSFKGKEGTVTGRLHARPVADALAVDASMEVDNVRLGLLAPDSQDRSVVPAFFGRAELRGTGSSVHEIMASSNGLLDLREGSGKLYGIMESRLTGDLILQILNALNPMYKKEPYVKVECGLYNLRIDDGVVTLENVAVQSDKLALIALGQVNLANETLDLSVRMRPRKGFGVSIGGVANSFLKVGGTLTEPKLMVDPTRSAATTGAAVATGGMSIFAKGLWDRIRGEKDICKDAGLSSR
jgi:uncharacterized protein involved in outer membrane biogenesis